MKKFAIPCTILGAILALPLYVGSAQAQATRTWVSGVGDDANPCSRTAPCKTFAGAISKTAAKGEINCLDPGGFGTLNITKSITVNCENTLGGVLSAGVTGFIVNVAATDAVTLKGLDIEGTGTGTNGIRIIGGGQVHIHKVQIRNVTTACIDVANTALAVEVYISESYMSECAGNGIVTNPGAVNSVVMIHNVRVENSGQGITFNRVNAGTTKASVSESTVTGNGNNGITTSASVGSIDLMLQKNVITFNGGNGVSNNGGGSVTRIGGSVVNGNGTAVANAGGTFQSYKDNQIDGNAANGALPLPQVQFN